MLTKQNANEQMLDQIADSGELAESVPAFCDAWCAGRSAAHAFRADPGAGSQSRSARAGVARPAAVDGRLTAEHVLRRWKLNADLVTLSACDTGLGEFSGGEGYLGFSQALFPQGRREASC